MECWPRNGTGLTSPTELRSFLVEYAHRLSEHGPRSLPSSFNVIGDFFEFKNEIPWIYPLPETDHIVPLHLYLDWYTSPGVDLPMASLADILEEGQIYHYELTSDQRSRFVEAQGEDYVLQGVSFVVRGTDLTVLCVGGRSPLNLHDFQVESGTPAPPERKPSLPIQISTLVMRS